LGVKVGINGFGSIGKRFYRTARSRPEVNVVATNDLTDARTLAHLLKYDSTYGPLDEDVAVDGEFLVVGDDRIRVFSERDPANIPWSELGVEVVVEATGLFRDREHAELHMKSGGARKVIISAPGKDEDITLVMGVNDGDYDPQRHHVLSNASCTTNCLGPVAKVLHEEFGIVKGQMTTVHAYTNDQRLLDLPHKDLRRARAAAQNIVPTTTGAAVAVTVVLPELEGKLDGFALRVPVPTVSLLDLTCLVGRRVSADDVNAAMRKAAEERLRGILCVVEDPVVSSDLKGRTESAIVDALSTMVVGGDLVKVVAWYDNEWAYSERLVDMVEMVWRRGL